MTPRKATCPTCGNRTGARIVYGMPDVELVEQAQRGEVSLGGCLIFDGQPTWRCLHVGCGAEW